MLTILTSVLLVAGFAGTAGAATEVDVSATGQNASYADSTNMGKAVYQVEVTNLTGGTESVSTTVATGYPAGVSVTGVTATATDAAGNDLETVAGEPSDTAFVIDTTDLPDDQTITYQVTVGFTYENLSGGLLCAKDGGLAVTVTAGEEATATACVDAPAPAATVSEEPVDEQSSASSESAAASSDTSSSSAADQTATGDAAADAGDATSDPATTSGDTKDAPQQQSSPQVAPQQTTAATTAAPTDNPVGDFGTWANNDGLIYFSGWAYDPSDMSRAPITMWTIDGEVVGYQAAQIASPDLYPYGVYNRGVFGAFTAPSPGAHSICMFVFNIGAGADQLVRCHTVTVPNADPTGDIWAAVRGDGSILVHGYAYDPSNTAAQPAVWITDNGKVVGGFYANAAAPSLAPYGVFGNHGIDFSFAPVTTGVHNLCLYVHNIGWGTGQWPRCVNVTVDVNPARDNPRGDFAVTSNSGWVSVSGWAYDPNQPYLSATTMWTVDGKVAAYSSASQPHSGVNNYLGIPGNHGFSTNVPAGQGWHTVCMFVSNIGLGESVVTRCQNVNVVAPPNPCPAYAKACIDLTNNTTWLQTNGQITAGPFKQIAGRAGYRTPTGTFKVFWKHIDHVSSIYNAPMPYSIFFNGGIAFHVGSLTVPSHGCIHLSLSVAQLYWNNLNVGDTVYVFGAAQY